MKATARKTKPEKFTEFMLELAQAKTVAVAGSFNQWRLVPMRKEGACWRVSLVLAPGRHEYRFVVDGRWIEDPRATEWVANPFGGRNAVLTVPAEPIFSPDLAVAA